MARPARRRPAHVSAAAPSGGRDRIADAARALASPLGYESARAWALAAHRLVADALGAGRSFVHWVGADRFVSGDYGPSDVAAYRAFLPLLQEIGYTERSERLGVFTRRDAYGPHYDRMAGTPYVQEFLPSVGAHDALTLYVPGGRPIEGGAREPAVQLVVHPPAPGRAFEPERVEVARRLHPAFLAGVMVHRQLAQVRVGLLTLVDAAGGPCAVFSAAGRLLHLSRGLEEALTREPLREALLDRVRHLAAAALAAPSQAGAAVFAGGAGRYRLAASTALGARPLLVVAVTVPPPPRPTPTAGEVAERLGLTPRQSEVALLLAERRSNKEIAAALSVSLHTARHHVEAVLARLGVARPHVMDLV